MRHRADEIPTPHCGWTNVHGPHGECPGLSPLAPPQPQSAPVYDPTISQWVSPEPPQRANYELANFDPDTGHLHDCIAASSCDCIRYLYAAAEEEAESGYNAIEARTGLAEALRLTQEYVGPTTLPAVPGWSWYDALARYAPEHLPQEVKEPVQIRVREDGGVDVLNPDVLDGRGVLIVPPGVNYIRWG